MTRQEIIDELASWEKFAAEREAYPREQYEADKAKAIAEGVDPRLIMSYFETLSYMAWEAEKPKPTTRSGTRTTCARCAKPMPSWSARKPSSAR